MHPQAPPLTPTNPDLLDENSTALLLKSAGAANVSMRAAIEHIDAALGKGYAQKHPELIVGFLQVATGESLGNLLAFALESVATAVNDLSSTLAYLHSEPDDDASTAHKGGVQ